MSVPPFGMTDDPVKDDTMKLLKKRKTRCLEDELLSGPLIADVWRHKNVCIGKSWPADYERVAIDPDGFDFMIGDVLVNFDCGIFVLTPFGLTQLST